MIPDDCARCGGSRLMMGGWMGPTPERPYPDPCPVCSADLSGRERQVLQHSWLLDHQDEPGVKEVLSRMAVFNAQKYRLVLHIPLLRTLGLGALQGTTVSIEDVAEADIVVGAGNTVLKERYGITPYVLSDTEFRRVRDSAQEFRRR
jgi:hypothetical protein